MNTLLNPCQREINVFPILDPMPAYPRHDPDILYQTHYNDTIHVSTIVSGIMGKILSIRDGHILSHNYTPLIILLLSILLGWGRYHISHRILSTILSLNITRFINKRCSSWFCSSYSTHFTDQKICRHRSDLIKHSQVAL